MKKPTVVIAIPALNEEQNIGNLLRQLIEQSEQGFVIEKIQVISDGSTDNTVAEVEKIRDKRIELIIGKERLGKMKRLNHLYRTCTADVLIQYDADVVVPNVTITSDLVQPILDGADLVFGRQYPLEPRTLVEKAAHFGFYVWEDAKELLGEKANRYRVHGQIRAFSKKFYSKYQIPIPTAMTEDIFSFYDAMNRGFTCVFPKKVFVYFRLPDNTRDYVKQMSRFLSIPNNLELFFEKKLLKKYQTMNKRILIRSLIGRVLKTSPVVIVVFLYIHLLSKARSKSFAYTPLWSMTSSTKKIK